MKRREPTEGEFIGEVFVDDFSQGFVPETLREGDSDEDNLIVILPDEETEAPAPRRLETVQREAAPSSISEELLLEEAQYHRALNMPRLYAIFSGGVGLLLAVLLVVGWGYYRLPIGQRSLHHFHSLLRPTGTLGLTLGVAGTLLMFLSLTYLVRKRFVWLRMGSLRSWMGFHVFTGVVGPALILFHAGFVPYSALGILSYTAMGVVVVTGIIGRYIHAHVPTSLEGTELEFEVVRLRLLEYKRRLVELGVSASILDVEPEPPTRTRSPRLLGAFKGLLLGDRQSRREFKKLRATVRGRRELLVQAHRILPLMRSLCKERQWLARYQELCTLMGAWRFLHRWLAVVMLLVVMFHIAIGIQFGDLWIFGGKK